MSDELLLGIDVGTTNIKAVVFDLRGRPAGLASGPTPTLRPRPGWAEYEPEALWQAVVAAVRGALVGIDPGRVRGAAVASMGEAGLLIDAQGQPLYNAIAWYDDRSLPQYRWWQDVVGDEAIFAVTGAVPRPIFGISKLMWLRDNEPAIYDQAATWLNIADYIAYRLSGVQATDFSLATRTMALDIVGRRWSQPLIERAGLRPSLFAPLVASGTALGGVSAEAAAATGLLPGTAVGAGGHDHVCGALAVGISQAGICLDSMGTAEAAFVALDVVRLDARLRQGNFSLGVHVARDKYYLMNGLWTSGAAVDWARNLVAWPGEGDAFTRMEAAAALAPVGSLGVLFLPRLAAGDRGAYVGLTSDVGPAVLGRALYEGLAYEWRYWFEALAAFVNVPISTIKVIGGGARCSLWLQIKADVLGLELQVLEVDESVALGAALLGGLAAGVYRDEAEAQAALTYGVQCIAPDPERSARYEQWYRRAYLPLAGALSQVHAVAEELCDGDEL